MLTKKYALLEVNHFARNIYEMETATSGLCYIEDLIFLENNIVCFRNSLDVQSTNSLVELYNIVSYCRSFFQKFSAPFFGKECIIQKNLQVCKVCLF